MNCLVKFVVIRPKNQISDKFLYCKDIINTLSQKGFLDRVCVIPGNDSDYVCTVDDELGLYSSTFISGSSAITIQFKFGTYKCEKQLEIAIGSDNYSLCVENDYIERLKIFIKETIKHDWISIVWLYDKDSQCLSADLYPIINKTENSIRQLINEVMTKNFGIDWWDRFVPKDVKDKHKARRGGYKSTVPSFANVDERLMSIDVDDLYDIITNKTYALNISNVDFFNNLLNKQSDANYDSIISELRNNSIIKNDLWIDIFSNYLSNEFIDNYKEFYLNRNHIMHNKLIDRNAYKQIKASIEIIQNDVNQALQKVENSLLSSEEKHYYDRVEEEALYEAQERYAMIAEAEAGVNVRSNDEIKELFFCAMGEFEEDIWMDMRFRNDIETESWDFNPDCSKGNLLKIVSRLNDEEFDVNYEFEVNDEEGASSTLTIFAGDSKTDVIYINGQITMDDDQGYFVPLVEDEFDYKAIKLAQNQVIDKANAFFDDVRDNIIEQINNEDMKMKKNENRSVLSEVECAYCSNSLVYSGNSILNFGQCPQCGCINEVRECIKCGSYFNAEIETKDEQGDMCNVCFETFIEKCKK